MKKLLFVVLFIGLSQANNVKQQCEQEAKNLSAVYTFLVDFRSTYREFRNKNQWLKPIFEKSKNLPNSVEYLIETAIKDITLCGYSKIDFDTCIEHIEYYYFFKAGNTIDYCEKIDKKGELK